MTDSAAELQYRPAPVGRPVDPAPNGSRGYGYIACCRPSNVSIPPALRRPFCAAVLAIAFGAGTVNGAGREVSEFTKHWTGRRVAVRSALFTVVYDEVGRLGKRYTGKLAGLTVVTPNGEYYEFDGPGSDEDIAELTPERVFDQMSLRFYRSNPLELSNIKTITPMKLRRFDPGAGLIVESVKVDRNRVRLEFRRDAATEPGFATSLTIEWPAAFSKDFTERDAIHAAIQRYVAPL